MLDDCYCVVTAHSPAFTFELRDAQLDRLARPTVQDLLEYAAERHYVDCDCGVKIGGRVWYTCRPLSEADECEWETETHNPLALHTELRALPGAALPSAVQLVIAGQQHSSTDFLRLYREKLFTLYRVEDAVVCKRAGPSTLASEKLNNFDEMCSRQGSVFVDKTKFLRAMLSQLASGWRVNIIRRPKGFGKTTFVSMFNAYFDILSTQGHFPFTFTEDMSQPVLREHGQLLVFALDFAELAFDKSMGRAALEAECNRLLDAAALKFYDRYQKILGVAEEEISRSGVSPSFFYIVRWAKLEGYKLCFTIDNYTAPFVDGPDYHYQDSISRRIFSHLSDLVSSRFILYGLIVGDDVPHCADWDDMPCLFADVTDSPKFWEAFGFTAAEVEALGRAVSIDLTSALQTCTLIPSRTEATKVYSSADILSLARQMVDLDGLARAQVQVRTFPPPLAAIPVEQKDLDGDDKDSDDVEMHIASYSRACSPCSDGEEDENNSVTRSPAMTADNSSNSTSSSSPGTTLPSSSSSSSAGDKQLRLATAEEPPSPLEAYSKKPWDANRL